MSHIFIHSVWNAVKLCIGIQSSQNSIACRPFLHSFGIRFPLLISWHAISVIFLFWSSPEHLLQATASFCKVPIHVHAFIKREEVHFFNGNPDRVACKDSRNEGQTHKLDNAHVGVDGWWDGVATSSHPKLKNLEIWRKCRSILHRTRVHHCSTSHLCSMLIMNTDAD